jgi:hypothetical protein
MLVLPSSLHWSAFHMMITLPELGRASGFRVTYPAEVLILESGLASGLLL